MNTPLDNAIVAASAAEATYTSSVNNVATIHTAIDTATAPLSPAKAQLSTDQAAFNTSMDNLSAAALGSKVPTSAAPGGTQSGS